MMDVACSAFFTCYRPPACAVDDFRIWTTGTGFDLRRKREKRGGDGREGLGGRAVPKQLTLL
jgi:hypothetical protein